MAYYGAHITQTDIDFLLNWGPIMYLPVVPFVMMMLSRCSTIYDPIPNPDTESFVRGPVALWRTMFCGGFLCLSGSLIRVIPTWIGDSFLRSEQETSSLIHIYLFQYPQSLTITFALISRLSGFSM